MSLRARARLGRQAHPARGATATATGWAGTTPRLEADRPAVRRRTPGQGPLPPARRPWAGSSGCSTTPTSSAPCTSRPEDTRAYFRGRCLEKYSDAVAAASWDSVDLRPARARLAAARPDSGAAARHPRARRRPARPLRDRRGPACPRSPADRAAPGSPRVRTDAAVGQAPSGGVSDRVDDRLRRTRSSRGRSPGAVGRRQIEEQAPTEAADARRAQGEARRRHRRDPRRDRRGRGVQRRGLRARFRAEGRAVASMVDVATARRVPHAGQLLVLRLPRLVRP